MDDFEAYILAGGRSSRMGTEKAMLRLGGLTLIQRSAGIIADALMPSKITVVGGHSDRSAFGAIAFDLPFIFDLHEGRGPLGGLHAALANAQTAWTFLLACDLPFVPPELIQLLATNISDEFGAVIPEQPDLRLQPLCGFYRRNIASDVLEAIFDLSRPTPPMHEIVHQMHPRIVRFAEFSHLAGIEDSFLNVNSPDDLEVAKSRFDASEL